MRAILAVLILLGFILFGCENNNPVGANNKSHVLFFSSFENQGIPTLSPWTNFSEPIDTQSTFSRDVPPGSGQFSLRLSYHGTESISAGIRLSKSDSLTRYLFSYLAKGNGFSQLQLSSSVSGRVQWNSGNRVNLNTWLFFTDTLTSLYADYDTLNVFLYRWVFDTTAITQFDEIQIVEQLP